jgi:hypothetical protein
MIPFPASECWLIGSELRSIRTGNSIPLKIAKNRNESGFDGLDCGAGDLRVTHLKFCGDIGILEFVNRVVAGRFDLDTSGVSVEYGDPLAGVLQGNIEPAYPAYQVLKARVIHSVIPRHLRIRYLADRAAQRQALEAEKRPTTTEAGAGT